MSKSEHRRFTAEQKLEILKSYGVRSSVFTFTSAMQGSAHYNYYRDYDPDTGRYLQPDPIGLAGGVNPYSYVGNNPLRFIDPFGLLKCSCSAQPLSGTYPNPPDYSNKACTYDCTCDCPATGGKDTRPVYGPGTIGPYGALCFGQRDIPQPGIPPLRAEFRSIEIDTETSYPDVRLDWLKNLVKAVFGDCEGCPP